METGGTFTGEGVEVAGAGRPVLTGRRQAEVRRWKPKHIHEARFSQEAGNVRVSTCVGPPEVFLHREKQAVKPERDGPGTRLKLN